jgi:hypothetical protein
MRIHAKAKSHSRTPASATLAFVLSIGSLLPAAALAGTAAIQLDASEMVEYWYWAGGVVVNGSGFAPSANVVITDTDPNGAARQFAAVTDESGVFSLRVNAMKLHSALGEHVISAEDAQNALAQATLAIIHDPDDVLDMTAKPDQLPLADFNAHGSGVHIGGLTPNGRVRINLGDPADNMGELMTTTQLFADADGNFDFVLDPNTQIFGAGVGAVIPTAGIWTLSAFDMSGANNHLGSATFRMLPDNPGPESYCSVGMSIDVEPITRVRFAGIDNASAIDSQNGYEDFTGVHGQAAAGQTYAFRAQGKAKFSFDANTYTVFIDWNHDGILDEPGEIYSVGGIVGSTGEDGMEVLRDLTVPANAAPGPTRMRVLKVYSPSPFAMYWPSGACGSYRWGQVEDYTLDVTGGDTLFDDGFEMVVPATPPMVAASFAPSTVATNTPVRLSITLANANAMPVTLAADLIDAFPSGLVSAASASTTCTGGSGITQTGSSVTLGAGATVPAAGLCTISVDVAAQVSGSLTNTIATGALMTDVGSNTAAANATLTVTAPAAAPTLAMNFSPSTVPMNTPTSLTITLSNGNAGAATLTSDLLDAFPSGLVSAASASTTCMGGSGIAQTGTSVTLLAGATIPAAGSCTIHVDVAAVVSGDLTNTIATGALVTDAGSNAAAASATLTATSP